MDLQVSGCASVERLVVAATMGPTIHDTHAWRFKVVPGSIEVHADPARFRPMHDPSGRGLHLSCGAALVNLRLAAAQIGHEAVVRLLPDRTRPTLLACARLAGHRRISKAERLLYAAALRPFPARVSYGGERPPVQVLNELAEAARLEGATLHAVPGAGAYTAMLTTQGDTPAAWLRGGQALQRVLLTSAVRAVSASFMYEVVDMPATVDLLQQGDAPQVLLKLAKTAVATRPIDRQLDGQRDLNWVGQLRQPRL